ncbi:hypothetical protein [Metabacillus malikii]|uniref:Uncharacterized protein n=1 Tax=Metabacillus malikii TaxID=1504265 RepID=A0ABT9ZJQ7_9BACI|nr:hypothetical protein [Metabacillus malikii]MDQ0232526.1 hypothetical protein [Metabacillus malikii]
MQANIESKIHNHYDKYPTSITEILKTCITSSNSSQNVDELIESLPKMEVLNLYFQHTNQPLTGQHFRKIVYYVFGMDLDYISNEGEGAKLSVYPDEVMDGMRKALNHKQLPTAELDKEIMSLTKAEVMDIYIDYFRVQSHEEVIRILNLIYGVNLRGLSTLENSRITLYTKKQWLFRKTTNLFEIHTGKGDIDVTILPTAYFIENTGINDIPNFLKTQLSDLGFIQLEGKLGLYYSNPNGETVSDQFKLLTINTIRKAIDTEYKNL